MCWVLCSALGFQLTSTNAYAVVDVGLCNSCLVKLYMMEEHCTPILRDTCCSAGHLSVTLTRVHHMYTKQAILLVCEALLCGFEFLMS